MHSHAPTFSCAQFIVRPQPGNLTHASIKVPTPRGPIQLTLAQSFALRDERRSPRVATSFKISLHVPGRSVATVCVPRLGSASPVVHLNGAARLGVVDDDFVCVAGIGASSAPHELERRG